MTVSSNFGWGVLWFGLTFAVVVTAHPAAAQVLYGSITGQVLDQTGAIVPNATVSVINRATAVTAETLRDQGGRYNLPNLQPGTCEITSTATGFKTLAPQNVARTINNMTRVEVNLEVG
jgi:hypothetical protein